MSLPIEETWRPIPGHEGRYSVSDHGRVRSTPRPSTRGGILAQKIDKDGYRAVTLWRDGGPHHYRVHRLVLTAFCGEPAPGHVGRHRDADPSNNRLTNLSWGTPLENTADMIQMGRQNNARKTHCVNGHEFTEANTYTGRGQRECRACGRQRARQRRAAA